MRMKRFAILVAVLVVAASALYGSGVMGTSAEADDSDERSYRWLAAAGMTEFGLLCDLPTPCPDVASSTARDAIEITGEGTLTVEVDGEDFDPEDATGGGSFRHVDTGGEVLGTGTWTVKKLISFEEYGAAGCCPPTWRQGDALFEVELVSDAGGMKFDGILRVGCKLPGGGPTPAGAIEGAEISVDTVGDFVAIPEDRSTLFILLGDNGEGDDDDGDGDDDDD